VRILKLVPADLRIPSPREHSADSLAPRSGERVRERGLPDRDDLPRKLSGLPAAERIAKVGRALRCPPRNALQTRQILRLPMLPVFCVFFLMFDEGYSGFGNFARLGGSSDQSPGNHPEQRESK